MSFFDRLLGRQAPEPERPTRAARGAQTDDEAALERYRYLLRTAPPEDIERAHEEAFATLNADQRRQVLQQLSAEASESERRGATEDPASLARLATRAEMRRPGTLERSFGSMSMPGIGMGGIFLSSMAGTLVGTAVAQSFFADHGGDQGDGSGTADSGNTDSGDASGESSGDSWGGQDASGPADAGSAGDIGSGNAADVGAADFGGDTGGGDFGGDFGGGDFGGGFGGDI